MCLGRHPRFYTYLGSPCPQNQISQLQVADQSETKLVLKFRLLYPFHTILTISRSFQDFPLFFIVEPLYMLDFLWVWLILCHFIMSIHRVSNFWFITELALGQKIGRKRHTGLTGEPLTLTSGSHAQLLELGLVTRLTGNHLVYPSLNFTDSECWQDFRGHLV